MKLHKDKVVVGTKVYSYHMKHIDDEYQLFCRVGQVVEKEIRNAVYRDVRKVVAFSGEKLSDQIYFRPKDDYCIFVDEYQKSRVLLLEDNPARALEIFLAHEDEVIATRLKEIERRKIKADSIRRELDLYNEL